MAKTFTNLSPHMLKTFDECQMKFFFKYIEKISIPQNAKFFEKGKKIHALANYYLKGEDIEKMEHSLDADEKNTWQKLKNNSFFKMDVVNTEYNISSKIGNHWIGGRLDALMKNADDYFILDYKTGKIPANAESDFQTIVYLLSAEKLLKQKKIPFKSLQFVYLGLKEGVEKSILLDETLKKQYEERVLKTSESIDFAACSTVYSKNLEACKNCEYNKICRR